MNTIVRKPLMIKIIKLHLRNVEITIKMKTIVWKSLMIKIIKLHLRNLDNQCHFLYVYISIFLVFLKFVFFCTQSSILTIFQQISLSHKWDYGGRLRSRVKLCCHLISDSILRLFYFTPCCLVDVTPWTRRPKKNYTKEDSNRSETKTFLSYFSFVSWVQQPLNLWRNFPWIQLKWLNPPVMVFKNMLIISWYMFVLIWYFKAFDMVLVAFGSLSKSSVLIHSSIS